MRSSVRPLLRLEAIEIGRVRLRYGHRESCGGWPKRRQNRSSARLSKDGEFDSLLAVVLSHCPKQHSLLEARRSTRDRPQPRDFRRTVRPPTPAPPTLFTPSSY